MRDLHNCSIKVTVSDDNEPFIFVRTLEGGRQSFSGREIKILRTLSEAMNFHIDFAFIGAAGFIYGNGSAKGALKALSDGTADLSVSNWWLKPDRLKFFSATSSHSSTHLIFVVPPGRELTMLEKFTFPFEFSLWLMIGIVFCIGVIVICFVKIQSKTVRNFVFGTGIESPLLNLIAAFIGIAQKKLPGRNFARFLLMMFLIYSLVIRTVYQASFYKLMQSNKHHKEVQSLDEMIEKDFKFYIHLANEDFFNSIDGVKSR
jgi:hypothetical protein